MTNAISRLHSAIETWSFRYNCYEAIHPWTPFCSHSALELGVIVFGEAIKLYTPLYLFSQLMQRRVDYDAFKNTTQSILRSTTFISANAFFALLFFCSSQYFTAGKFYYYVLANIPGFLASSMAVLIEKPNRRSSLAFYVANVASEALFRIWVARGYIRPIPNGQVYIFTLAIATIMLLAKRKGFEDDPLSAAIKLIVGPEEAAIRIRRSRRERGLIKGLKEDDDEEEKEEAQLNKEEKVKEPAEALQDIIEAAVANEDEDCHLQQQQQQQQQQHSDTTIQGRLKRTYKWIKQLLLVRHRLCPHENCSCLYYVLKSSSRALLIGYTGQLGLKLLTKTIPQLIVSNNPPREEASKLIGQLFADTGLYRIGLFLATFSGLYKASNCCLRWTLNKSSEFNCFLAGLLAGPALFIYPSPTVALYVVWKCLEILFHESVNKGIIKNKEFYIVILYGLATNQLFYSAIMDPNYMKKSYMQFLNRMSHHRLHMVNRTVLDVFGTAASSGYEEYFPDLHPGFMSQPFLGSIWIWMLDNKFQVSKRLSSSPANKVAKVAIAAAS